MPVIIPAIAPARVILLQKNKKASQNQFKDTRIFNPWRLKCNDYTSKTKNLPILSLVTSKHLT